MDRFKWRLKNITNGQTLDITKSVFNVGRNIKADLTSINSSLSRNHATLYVLVDGLLYILDNKSCNGTFVNNKKIPTMETLQLKHGDVVGFGTCEQLLCVGQNIDTPDLIFEVIRCKNEGRANSENETHQQNETNVKSNLDIDADGFSIGLNECIIISDGEEDDNAFNNSQIFRLSEKIKSEPISVNENVDPYSHIKQELEDLDYCDNIPNVVDITNDQENFSSTSELINILESSINGERKNVDEKCNNNLSPKAKYVKPPIIEPHNQHKGKSKVGEDRSKQTKKRIVNKTDQKKKSCKRKNTDILKSPEMKKKPKMGNTFNESRFDKKSIKGEFKKRNKGKCTSPCKKDLDTKNKTLILTERKKKLKEITEKDNNKSCQKPDLKTSKPTSKIKTSSGRGNFLLESTLSSTRKNMSVSVDSFASTSKLSSENIANDQVSDKEKEIGSNKIQDTTISSNYSPKSDANKFDVPNSSSVSSNVATKSCDFQRPDSTFNEDRSSFIWQNTSSLLRFPLNNIHRNIGNMDEEICKIVHWSVKWIMEQNNCDMSPPVHGEKKPLKMPVSFKSFPEYSSIVSPLIMLELWQYVYQTFYNKDEQRTPIRVFLNHKRSVGKLMYLDCECYISEEEVRNNNVFRADDFALIEVKLKDEKNCYLYTSFGYIKFCKRINLQDDMYINNQIADLCPNIPHTNLKFSVVTRNLPDKEIVGKQIIVKTVGNVGSSMRLLKTIKYLETSPICNRVLRPTIEDYKISVKDRNLVVEVKLNKQQKETVLEACSLCLKNEPGLYLIKGPPGTGKSTVIINIVLQILFSSDNCKKRTLILLTAPSNAAVDGLILKLAEIRTKLTEAQKKILKLVRIGPDSSISKNVNKFKLSSLARNHILKEKGLTNLEEFKKVLENDEDVDTFIKRKLGHNYFYEMRCAEDVLLTGSNVICTTLNSSVSSRIMEFTRRDQLKFSCCIVDEATQCTEAEALLPLQLGVDKFILVGDPQQLPAVVCNKDAQRLGYGKSLFARIDDNFQKHPNSPVQMLCEQYRMKKEICEYPNKMFYGGKLKSFPIHINKIIPELKPYLLFNIVNAEQEDNYAYTNLEEVEFVCIMLDTLQKCIQNHCKYTIGIITPYRAQKDLLIRHISNIRFNSNVSVTVNTVDSFQGMENDVVIISCVRYTPNYFLQNEQRLNVALTRARQALYIVGNYTLFKHCRLLYDLREDAKKRKFCIDINQNIRNIPNLYNYLIKR